ncbi:hypothetical protein [Sphaerisporangium sp. NPDC051011]|uniref:hypothetical protein n=1 Tax=Sphaerisporangium sp. NPDC051011 TaxID=3155792 RepID=UPI0033C74CFC
MDKTTEPTDEAPFDYEAIRKRFRWVGSIASGERELSQRYRQIMAKARKDREIVEAIDAIWKSE